LRDFPALIAGVKDGRGRLVAVQRTWLVQRNGRCDRVRRENEGVDGKMCLGPCRGASVHVWHGEHVDQATGEILPGPSWSGPRGLAWLHCTEGVEDALAVAAMDLRRCVVATLGAGNLRRLELPQNVIELTWWADADSTANHAVHAGLCSALAEHEASGRVVHVHVPPPGAKDWADAFRMAVERSAPHVTAT
jgi:hypothetical protein